MTQVDSAIPARRRRWPGPEVIVPSVIIAACIGYPFYLLVTAALNVGDPLAMPAVQFGLSNFPRLLDHLDWILNTLFVSVVGTLLALAIGISIAWILHRTTVPGARIFERLVVVPFPLGALLAGLAWNVLGAPRSGLINQLFFSITHLRVDIVNVWTPFGIAFVMALFEAPVAFLIIGPAMSRMDASLEECSAVHGASRGRTIFRVTLPLMLPAITSAALFVFVSMLGSFAIPAILGAGARFNVVTTAIYNAFNTYPPDYPLAGVLALVLLVITWAMVWLNTRLLARRSYVVLSGKNYRPRRLDMGRWTWVLFAYLCLYTLLAVVLPVVTLILTSLQPTPAIDWSGHSWTLGNYQYVLFAFPMTQAAIVNTLLVGVAVAIVGVVIVTVIAWIVHRSHGPGRRVLETLTVLPQAFPRLVFGVGLLWVVLALPINIYGTLYAVFFAYLIIFLPLGYRSMSGVMVQIDRALEEAGRVGGSSWLRTMRTITVPLLRPGIAATAGLLFMTSVQEVSTSLFLSGSRAPVLGPAMLSFWFTGGLPVVSALAIVQAAIILAVLTLLGRLSRIDVRGSL